MVKNCKRRIGRLDIPLILDLSLSENQPGRALLRVDRWMRPAVLVVGDDHRTPRTRPAEQQGAVSGLTY